VAPGGVWIVIECFLRKAAASAAVGGAVAEVDEVVAGSVGETAFDGAEEDSAVVDVEGAEVASSFLRFFLSFLSFLDDEDTASALGSSPFSSLLRFFFFSDSPASGMVSIVEK